MDITSEVLKELQKIRVPQVRRKFFLWVSEVETKGLLEARRRPGWYDEPLKGSRIGQRSARLNDQWRVIYWEKVGTVCIEVIEVTPLSTKRKYRKSVRAMEALRSLWAKESFGSFVRSIRESDNISQAELARRLDVSRQFLNAIEGERKAVGVEFASRIADALGYSEELFLELAIRDQLLRAGKKFMVTLKAG